MYPSVVFNYMKFKLNGTTPTNWSTRVRVGGGFAISVAGDSGMWEAARRRQNRKLSSGPVKD